MEHHRNGQYFLHEHPKPSRSWRGPCIERLQAMDGVYTVQAPMCKWHMKAEDGQGVGFVRKETCYVTNSAEMAKALEAQVYPPKLVNAILKGIKKELMNKGEISELSSITAGPSPDETSREPTEHFFNPDVKTEGVFFDSVTGTPLKTDKVWEARREEMTWAKKQDLYEVVDEQVCWDETGRGPIGLKWVDRNKGDALNENYRSRLVVREIKRASVPLAELESFSAMPPLEALKVLCSLLVSKKVSKSGQPLKLRLIDISAAHFYGQARRRVFCNLPEGEEIAGKCAVLKRSMHGALDAASTWQQTYADVLKKNNIKQCVAWPALSYQEDSDLRFMVHGDDFISLGDDSAQNFLEKVLSEKFEYRWMARSAPDGTAMCVLNRVLEVNKDTGVLTYEADPRHAEHIIRALNLEESKSVSCC